MSHVGKGYDVNQTFIIEPLDNGVPIFSACTALYTNFITSCSGNTNIFLQDGIISFDGNLYTNNDLSASTVYASTYYSGGTNLFDIINDLSLASGSFNNNTDTLTLTKQNGGQIIVTGFTDYYTTGTTIVGDTVYFNRNDQLSAYTLNLSQYSADTYVTGVTFNDNQLIIARNDGVNLNTFINTFTGLTINGLLTASSISATTISATTFYGDGSNLTGISTQDTFVTGGTYSDGVAIFTNNTGGTFNVYGFYTGATDVYITGATYNDSNLFTFTNNTGGTFNVLFNTVSGFTVNNSLLISGASNPLTIQGLLSSNDTTLITIDNNGVVHTIPTSGITTVTNAATGGTYYNGTISLSGTGTVGSITGLTNYFISATTPTGVVISNGDRWFNTTTGAELVYIDDGDSKQWVQINSSTIVSSIVITGGTYSNENIILTDNNNNNIIITGITGDVFTGGTVTGATNFTSGLSANTFSATTYLGLPIDITTTGGTYDQNSGVATFTNNTGGTFTVSGFSTFTQFTGGTVTGSTQFTNGLTANTISATTYQNLPTDIFVTGATYNNGTATFTNNTGGTFTVSGFSTSTQFTGGTVTGATNFAGGLSATTYLGLPTDIRITGGSYNNNTGIATFTNNTGGTFTVSGFSTGFTPSTDIFVTGSTYSNNTFTFTNNTGGTFNVLFNTLTGLTVNGTLTVTGNTNISGTTTSAGDMVALVDLKSMYSSGDEGGEIFLNKPVTNTSLSGGVTVDIFQNKFRIFEQSGLNRGVYVDLTAAASGVGTNLLSGGGGEVNTASNLGTGVGLYAQKVSADLQFKSLTSTGGTVTISSNSNTVNLEVVPASNFTGGTVNGATVFTNGLTANTISATTYQNLPKDIFTTGGTYSTGTAVFTNNTGGTFSVTGFYTGATDVFTTGGTYSNNTFTYTNNTGGTFTTTFNTLTGLTVNGTLTSTTISATTYQNLPTSNTPDAYNTASSVSPITWNVSGVSSNYVVTLTAATTTINLTNVRNGDYGTIILTQGSGGSKAITLGTINGSAGTHKVVNGGAGAITLSTTASAIDVISFTYDGSAMFWNYGLNYT